MGVNWVCSGPWRAGTAGRSRLMRRAPTAGSIGAPTGSSGRPTRYGASWWVSPTEPALLASNKAKCDALKVTWG